MAFPTGLFWSIAKSRFLSSCFLDLFSLFSYIGPASAFQHDVSLLTGFSARQLLPTMSPTQRQCTKCKKLSETSGFLKADGSDFF